MLWGSRFKRLVVASRGRKLLRSLILITLSLYAAHIQFQMMMHDFVASNGRALDALSSATKDPLAFVNPMGIMLAGSYPDLPTVYINESEVYRSYPPTRSLYESRTGDPLPDWAYKFSFLPRPNKTVGEKTVCFVHVGKTSGSTLGCYLGFRYDCGDEMNLPKSRLLYHTESLIHNWVNNCPQNDDYYLFTIRDPVARMKSWFTYERAGAMDINTESYDLRKPLFVDCPFRTFGDLVEYGLGNHFKSKVSKICRQRAWDAVRGNTPFARHNFFNYQYYRNEVPANATIIAIRSEFLERDWLSAETFVAKTTPNQHHEPVKLKFPRFNASRNITSADRNLSKSGLQQLCLALCREIKAYIDLLHLAINLSPVEVKESLRLLRMTCPRQVDDTTCETKLLF